MWRSLALVFGTLTLIAALSVAAIRYLPDTLHYPVVKLRSGTEFEVIFLGNGVANIAACTRKTSELARPLRDSNAGLDISTNCWQGLDVESRKLLSNAPLTTPSARMGNGVTVIYRSRDPNVALLACRQSEAASRPLEPGKLVRCVEPGKPR